MNLFKNIICKFLMQNSIKLGLKKLERKIKEKSPWVYTKILYKLKVLIKHFIYKHIYLKNSSVASEKLWIKPSDFTQTPLVSVIVPNYNHGAYLKERLESIYKQTYSNVEVILLDDASDDTSEEILKSYQKTYESKTFLYVNTENSGNVFKQWEKGMSLAKGQYIWIAESDDFCDKDFLEKLLPMLSDESVMLVFAKSIFMENNCSVLSTEEYLSDLFQLNFSKNFFMTAAEIVYKGFAVKNIIPNVSSCVFKNPKTISEEVRTNWKGLALCGDWLFYLYIIKGGIIGYCSDTANYYRIHEQSTSLKVQSTSRYYREYQNIGEYVVRNYMIDKDLIETQRQRLLLQYKAMMKNHGAMDEYYEIQTIFRSMEKRSPNIAICVFSMSMGGGEIFPLFLANALRRRGIAVTVFDFEMSGYNPKVRDLLQKEIPIVKVSKLCSLAEPLRLLRIEVVHSHHARVDEIVSLTLQENQDLQIKHMVTLHGMYEELPVEERDDILANVLRTCSTFVYTAQKNLESFKNRKDVDFDRFVYIKNGLERKTVKPVSRTRLGIAKEAFVFCLVSRAIPEKGWTEAVQAIRLARENSGLDIQLVLIGEGEMYESVCKNTYSFVHLLEARTNIRDYFAMADMGFLPSRYKGESYPLVIIDCLLSGRPVLASDIGEIKNQLRGEQGEMAGILFQLDNWSIPVEKVAALINELAHRGRVYLECLTAVERLKDNFDIDKIVLDYLREYKKLQS